MQLRGFKTRKQEIDERGRKKLGEGKREKKRVRSIERHCQRERL